MPLSVWMKLITFCNLCSLYFVDSRACFSPPVAYVGFHHRGGSAKPEGPRYEGRQRAAVLAKGAASPSHQLGVWASAVSSPRGVRSRVPAAQRFSYILCALGGISCCILGAFFTKKLMQSNVEKALLGLLKPCGIATVTIHCTKHS